MHLASENPEVQRRAMARGWRALGRVVIAFAVLSALAVFGSAVRVGNAIATRLSPSLCDGCSPAPRGSVVRRASHAIGIIEQVAMPQAGRSMQMFLASASDHGSHLVFDSARAGHLVARLDEDPRSVVWTIELVPRDSVHGAPVGRLVVGAGQPPLLVWGDSASRP